jgi:hypothetical protein
VQSSILKYFSVLLFSGVSAITCSQESDYKTIFGDDWKKAEEFISQNESWIRTELKKYDIGFYEAMAIIFPELVRYSALRDKMEITLLKALYINLGKEYANFSIGHFQMKPSFAETLGKMANETLAHRFSALVRDSTDFSDVRDFRSAVVKDLEDKAPQLNYLIVFYKICSKRFNLRKMEPEERIRFLATAYNYGFFKTDGEIRSMENRKFFSTTLFSKDLYSYADVSLFWYKEHQELK